MTTLRAAQADRTNDDMIGELCVNAIRTLTIDAVQKANSGHAGKPMGMAPVAFTLWQDLLRYDHSQPPWRNRDRFVLSAGHASLLLYSLIHLSGVKRMRDGYVTHGPAVSIADIRNFRQIDGLTPGHPEYGHTTGVETTTGPLGQGCARVSIEPGAVIGRDRYVGSSGEIIGMHTFGSSAPLKDLLTKFGFAPDKVVAAALRQIEQNKAS